MIGDFTWTGWDYIGEAGLAAKQYGTTKRSIYQPYPALLAGEPVIDITGHRQTQAYLNEIAWHLGNGPHLAVEPVNHSGDKVQKTGWRATNSIASWSWEGCEGRKATVEVYSDAKRVELQLNGRTVGYAPAGRDGEFLTRFTLPYEPGTSPRSSTRLTDARSGVHPSRLPVPGFASMCSLRAPRFERTVPTSPICRSRSPMKPAPSSRWLTATSPFTSKGRQRSLASAALSRSRPKHSTATLTRPSMDGLLPSSARDTSRGDVSVTVTAEGCEPVMVQLHIGDTESAQPRDDVVPVTA